MAAGCAEKKVAPPAHQVAMSMMLSGGSCGARALHRGTSQAGSGCARIGVAEVLGGNSRILRNHSVRGRIFEHYNEDRRTGTFGSPFAACRARRFTESTRPHPERGPNCDVHDRTRVDKTTEVIDTEAKIPWLILIVPGIWVLAKVWRRLRRNRKGTAAPAAVEPPQKA